jgi:hypothetical protein
VQFRKTSKSWQFKDRRRVRLSLFETDSAAALKIDEKKVFSNIVNDAPSFSLFVQYIGNFGK